MNDTTQKIAAEATEKIRKGGCNLEDVIQSAIEKAIKPYIEQLLQKNKECVNLTAELRAAASEHGEYVRCSRKSKGAMKLMGFDIWVKRTHAREQEWPDVIGSGGNAPSEPAHASEQSKMDAWQELHDSIIQLIPQEFRQNSTGAASCVKKLVKAYDKAMQINHEYRHGHRSSAHASEIEFHGDQNLSKEG